MNDTLLLVDNSYNAFYRINATMTWFKLSHPDIDFNEEFCWEENEEFLNKLRKMYLSSLNKIIKKHNIDSRNIYFCMDCSRKDIWRMELYNDYKKNRSTNTNLGGIFKYIYNSIIPELVKLETSLNTNFENMSYNIFKKIKPIGIMFRVRQGSITFKCFFSSVIFFKR